MNWEACYDKVVPYVIAITTPTGSGSGVILGFNPARTIIAIATAAHVVEDVHEWKQPIKLRQPSKKEVFATSEDRAIFLDRDRDSALIALPAGDFDIPTTELTMMEPTKFKRIGIEVGWMGYPGIASPHLCFFSGRISAFVNSSDSYLIDGVAIHGVSGGPVFACLDDDEPQLLGTVSSYMPNRSRGDALPGLLWSQDVTSFHDMIKSVHSIGDAQEKQEADDAARSAEDDQDEDTVD